MDLHEAAKRIFKNQRPDEKHQDSVEGVHAMIAKRQHETIERYKKWYKVDWNDMNNYDFVLDTTNLTPEDVVEKILEFVNKQK